MRERCADCELTETALAQLRALVGELVEAYEDQCAMEPDRELIARAREAADITS